MSVKHPKITVLLPVYNGEQYLESAIQSILDQTYTDFELLIVNDASTDGSDRIIRSFIDPRISIVTNKTNMRLLATLNIGLKAARGLYVARMDQDDISSPERLAVQAQFLDNHRDVGVVGSGFQLIDQHGQRAQKVLFPSSPVVLGWCLNFFNPLAHPTVMVRRSVIEAIGNYTSPDLPERVKHASEDYDLWRRAAKVTKLSNIPKVLLMLRKHQSNLTRVYQAEHSTDARRISRLAIADRLGHKVNQGVVDHLWLRDYTTVTEVRAVADLITKLYQSFMNEESPNPREQRAVAWDAAKRLIHLSFEPAATHIRPLIRRQARSITWLSYGLIPLLATRQALRRMA